MQYGEKRKIIGLESPAPARAGEELLLTVMVKSQSFWYRKKSKKGQKKKEMAKRPKGKKGKRNRARKERD